jgi:hypothetical protein
MVQAAGTDARPDTILARHRVAAGVTERRSQRVNGLPAGGADGAGRRGVERHIAREAAGGEEDAQDGFDARRTKHGEGGPEEGERRAENGDPKANH